MLFNLKSALFKGLFAFKTGSIHDTAHQTGRATPPWGRLAQLVERFLYTEDVGGSSPSSPTSRGRAERRVGRPIETMASVKSV
jgi:hypothetical protein